MAVTHVLFADDESRGDSICQFACFLLKVVELPFHKIFFSSTIFLGSSTQTIEFSRFSFSSSSCPIFAATFCHVLRKEGKHKESKNGEWGRTWGDDKQSLADDPQAVCVTHKSLSHKKHTIAAKPSLKKSADAFSLSCSKKPTKDPFFQILVTISHHCLHSFLLMTCFVSYHQISLTKHEERWKKTRNMRIKARRWKEEKVIFPWRKILIRRTSEAKKSEKKKRLVNDKMGKERNLKKINFEHNAFCFKYQKKKKKRETARCNGCPAAPRSLTTEYTWT